jgi:HPt (histidine-containing phosphotransfer) domain-containing protein
MSRLTQQIEICARMRSTSRAQALVARLHDELQRVQQALSIERSRF